MSSESVPRPRVVGVDVIYLDFDGVLHPQDVWIANGVPYVRSPQGHRLFENVSDLETLLKPYPDLRIVLSTTWQRSFGYRGALDFLTPALGARCVGGTWHNEMGRYLFDQIPRGEQVRGDVSRRRPRVWLAIDDDTHGWGDDAESHLIVTHPVHGIRDPAVFQSLQIALQRFSG